MLPSFTKLHYDKNWFSALFSIFTSVVKNGDNGEPLFWFKMNWSNGYKVYPDASCQNPILELRWQRKVGIWSWDVFVGERQVGNIRADFLKSAMSLGVEQWSLVNASGNVLLTMEPEKNAMAKHVFDDMLKLYNPTHIYALKTPAGKDVAYLTMKHGIWGSTYDFVWVSGNEEQRSIALALFVAILMMMKK